MSDKGNRRIEPESFAPVEKTGSATTVSDSERLKSGKHKTGKNFASAILVTVLVLVAIAVISLPLLNSDRTAPGIPLDENNEAVIVENSQEATPTESPWADSQLLRARREAQGILEDLLNLQETLEEAQVEAWASEKYEQVRELALTADDFYREREFEQAIGHYRQALEQAQDLNASIPEVASNLLADGRQYLLQNQIAPALEHLQLAEVLQPDSEAVRETLSRAQVRQKILSLMDESEQLARRGQQLDQAREKLVEARRLDSDYPESEAALVDIENRILERDFRQQMSKGFSALANAEYEVATRAFELAAQIKPEDPAVDGALQQVEAAKLNNERQSALSRASLLESREEWGEAHAIYRDLLAEDSSLSAARLGEIRTSARMELNKSILEILENPLSLQSDSAWQAGNQILTEARAINNPGERLLAQIEQLQQILKNARTPVMVKLESDNMTEVEIYRVGKIGTFSQQAVNLNPGNYVIVGRRSGFKDVRIELAIDGSSSEIEVPVICNVAI
ncbi:MAG: hypothetical protein RLN82_08370 [Pseudomonadales bacterium]